MPQSLERNARSASWTLLQATRAERGFYLHPELFGQPPERVVGRAPDASASASASDRGVEMRQLPPATSTPRAEGSSDPAREAKNTVTSGGG